MKIFYLFIIIFFVGCGSTNSAKINSKETLKDRIYVFSDSEVRNLKILFLGDTIIQISNRVNGLQATNYYLYNFTAKYSIEKIDLYRYIIRSSIEETDILSGVQYIHPYRKASFKCRADILPNIISDTLFFNQDFNKILLKDFSFDMKNK